MIAVLDTKAADGQAIVAAVNRTGLTGRNRDEELIAVIDEVLENQQEAADRIAKLKDDLSEASRRVAEIESDYLDLEYQNDEFRDRVRELEAELEAACENGVRSHE